ncbi:patatin-like phospholipase family protein [Actinomycetospora sp. C-140]
MGDERVGLVLSGAAARGPYQAGALSVLIPALREQGREPVVLLGTSSGGISATLLAQFADTGDDAGQHVADVWTGFGQVFDNPVLDDAGLRVVGRAVLAGSPWERFVGPVASLLDTAPLRRHAGQIFDADRVAAHVRAGRPETLAVAATVCPTDGAAARSRLFLLGREPVRPPDDPAVDVAAVDRIDLSHVLASAAIPVAFPPEYVAEPPRFRGYYVDGGVRLNAPVDAALACGVTRLVVVSGHSVGPPPSPTPLDPGAPPPDTAATAALSVRAVLTDGLADDLHALGLRNRWLEGVADVLPEDRRPYPRVPYLLVAPRDGQLARLAADTFRPSALPLDANSAVGRLLDALGDGLGRDELLSHILFDGEYAKQQVELGRSHAVQSLAAGWRYDPP